MKTIDELRIEIDEIDLETLKLLNKRATLAVEIGKIKHQLDINIHQPLRETQILEKLKANNQGPIKDKDIYDIYQLIFLANKKLEDRHR